MLEVGGMSEESDIYGGEVVGKYVWRERR